MGKNEFSNFFIIYNLDPKSYIFNSNMDKFYCIKQIKLPFGLKH